MRAWKCKAARFMNASACVIRIPKSLHPPRYRCPNLAARPSRAIPKSRRRFSRRADRPPRGRRYAAVPHTGMAVPCADERRDRSPGWRFHPPMSGGTRHRCAAGPRNQAAASPRRSAHRMARLRRAAMAGRRRYGKECRNVEMNGENSIPSSSRFEPPRPGPVER
jgi:hypothetical protein